MKELLFNLGITAGVALPLSLAVQNPATALSFNFGFNNALNGGGTVTGVIRGLEEGVGAADSVAVSTNTLGLGIGEYIGNPTSNTWVVSGGEIVAFNFFSFGGSNMPPAVTDATLFFDSSSDLGATFRAGLSSSTFSVVSASTEVTTQDIGLTFTPIPTPALLPGLIGMGVAVLRKRKQEKSETAEV